MDLLMNGVNRTRGVIITVVAVEEEITVGVMHKEAIL